jgi:hypothetical protein
LVCNSHLDAAASLNVTPDTSISGYNKRAGWAMPAHAGINKVSLNFQHGGGNTTESFGWDGSGLTSLPGASAENITLLGTASGSSIMFPLVTDAAQLKVTLEDAYGFSSETSMPNFGKYKITFSEISNGSISASTGDGVVTSGDFLLPGTNISLAPRPNAGYVFNANSLKYEYNDAGTPAAVPISGTSFTMPLYDISPAADFSAFTTFAELKAYIDGLPSNSIGLVTLSANPINFTDTITVGGGKNVSILPPSGTGTMVRDPSYTASTNKLFLVENGSILTLGNTDGTGSLILDGGYNNGSSPTVNAGSNGQLIDINGTVNMYGGVTLTQNHITSGGTCYGGAVRVYVNSRFNMYGGSINNNYCNPNGTFYSPGGVYISSGAVFTMEGGILTANEGYAGAVSLNGGTFILDGGTVSGNSVSGGGSYTGVLKSSGTYTYISGIMDDSVGP